MLLAQDVWSQPEAGVLAMCGRTSHSGAKGGNRKFAALITNGRDAQKVTFAKSGPPNPNYGATGPKVPLVRPPARRGAIRKNGHSLRAQFCGL